MQPANKLETEIKMTWQLAVVIFFVQFALFIFFYFSSIRSAVQLWGGSGAYNHCFIIAPIAAYLIYCDKDRLAGVSPAPSLWGPALCAVSSVAWWIAYMGGIAEGEHFALIGLIEGMLLTAFGTAVFRRLAIPFLYLFLMVPTGTFLLPVLQRITAVSSAFLLDLSGIETFRDGLLIEVPTGSYVVAPGCAGLNFLLASLALSIAYADLVYRDWSRRLACIALMLALAVAGNAMRVYLIILIAHFSGNVGNILDDHVLYGWGFFSLLIFAAMAFGHRFRQDPLPPGSAAPDSAGAAPVWRGVRIAAAALIALSLLPSAFLLMTKPTMTAAAPIKLSCGDFPAAPPSSAWLNGGLADGLARATCLVDDRPVHVALAELRRPLRDAKLYGFERRLVASDEWLETDRQERSAMLSGQPVSILAETFRTEGAIRTLWSVRWVDGRSRRPGLDTVVADLLAELRGGRRAALLVLMTDGAPEQAAATLDHLLPTLQLPGGDATPPA